MAVMFPGAGLMGQTAMMSAAPPTPLQVVSAMIAHEDDTTRASRHV